ncbi:MAG: hypothetical protein JWM17_2095 [Actinobacteria bacterium]|nr:hypothetical protein [Actinomycetota bacterium]
MGKWPSRATLHRWMTGSVQRLPYPDHCRILEGMFRGWTAEQLLQVAESSHGGSSPQPKTAELVEALRQGLAGPEPQATWSVPLRRDAAGSTRISTLPPRLSEAMHTVDGDVAHDLGRKLVALQKTLRLSDEETRLLANLAGHVVELSVAVAITIDAAGGAVATCNRELLNLTSIPLRRLPLEFWFKHTSRALTIWATPLDDHKVMIQRTHDAPSMSKFACQFAPAIEPGDTARFEYRCTGGCFLDELYWRQTVPRPTRHLTLNIRHEQASLLRCSAIEEMPHGSEVVATDDILWDYEGGDVTMTLTRDYLHSNQALTLRWEIDRDPSSS